MKILIASELFYPKLRGGEGVLWRVARGLAARGHSVRVITAKLEGTESRETVEGVEIIRPCEIGAKGKSKTFGAIGKKLVFMKKVYAVLRNEIDRDRPDVIYDNAYTATLPAGLAGKVTGLPVVTNLGNLQRSGHFEGNSNPFVAFIQMAKEYFFIRFGGHSGIRVPSLKAKKEVREITDTRVFTIPTPIDDDLAHKVLRTVDGESLRRQMGIDQEELFLLYVGALENVKNLDSLIDSLGDLSRPFRFIVVGEGGERSNLQRVAEQAGISENVEFLGRLEHKRVLELMKAADAFLLPSKSETGPLVVLEALSMNTKVVSTDVGIVPNLESDNLTVVDEVGDIVKTMERGLAPPSEEDFIEKYSIRKVSGEFERMFETVIQNAS